MPSPSGTDTRLRAALDGFPVAGLTGTLETGTSTSHGRGRRAGPGQDRHAEQVIALSGYVVDADGRLLVFSFIGNGLTPVRPATRLALDRLGHGACRLRLQLTVRRPSVGAHAAAPRCRLRSPVSEL